MKNCPGCGAAHLEFHTPGCPLRGSPPDLGVPTGVVPRVATSGWVQRVDTAVPLRVDPVAELERDLLAPDPEPGPMKGLSGLYAGPTQRALDDFFLMERKARAWDELVAFSKLEGSSASQVCAKLHDLVLKPRP